MRWAEMSEPSLETSEPKVSLTAETELAAEVQTAILFFADREAKDDCRFLASLTCHRALRHAARAATSPGRQGRQNL